MRLAIAKSDGGEEEWMTEAVLDEDEVAAPHGAPCFDEGLEVQAAADEVCAQLDRHGLAYSLVYTAADIAADPHYAARQTIATVATQLLGDLKMPAPQPRMSATPAGPLRPAPDLGQDTDAILQELLGMDRGGVERLRKAGIV